MRKIITVILVFFLAGALFAEGTSEKKAVEVKTINWYYPGGQQAEEELVWEEFNKELKGIAPIEVEFNRVDWSAFNDRMNIMIAAAERIDICFTSNWTNKFMPKVSDGAYLPLDDLIDEYAPALRSELPPFLFSAAQVGGETYAVPNYQTMMTWWSIQVPRELAEKYDLDVDYIKKGKDIIDQISRIEPFLEEIKKNEPDLYPFKAPFVWFGLAEQIAGTPIHVDLTKEGIELMDKKTFDENVKSRLTNIYRDWYRKGYIRKDVATVQDDRAELEGLRYAMWTGSYKPGAEAGYKATYNTDILAIPLAEPFIAADAGAGTMNAITINSRNPEGAIKFLEIMNTDRKMYNLLCFGIEDRHYTMAGENRIEQIMGDDGSSAYNPNTAWMFGNQFNAFLLPGQPDDLWELTDRANRSAKVSPIRGFTPNIDPVRNEIAQHQAADEEYWGTEYIYIDDEDAYEEMNKERYEKTMLAGYQKIFDEIQRQVKEWEATAK